MKKSNKILAVILALVMIITTVPMMTVFADDAGSDCAKNGHTYVQKGEPVEATCTEKGHTDYACVDCGDLKIAYTDALGHKPMGSYKFNENEHYKLCDVCGEKVTEEHNYEGAKVTATVEPTCENEGEGKVKCTACGYEKTDVVIPAKGHTYSAVVADKGGDTHSGICTVCNATKSEDHIWDEGVITKKPQCNANGEKTFTCTVCNATKVKTDNADPEFDCEDILKGHTRPEKANSLDEYKHSYTCTVPGCGAKTTSVEHTFVVAVGNKSNCDETVSLTITCKYCDYKAETKATEHDFDKIEKYDDKNHKQECKNCDTIVLTAHDWKDSKVINAATCKEDGEKEVKCACGETAVVKLPKLEEHKWDEGKVTTEATCGKAGVKTFTCSVCEKTMTEEIPATENHTWGEWTIIVPATSVADGRKTHECSVCGKKEIDVVKYEAPAEAKAGDVNADGNVTAVDARIVLQTVAGLRTLTEAETKVADMNEDGSITAVDARIILQMVAGLK